MRVLADGGHWSWPVVLREGDVELRPSAPVRRAGLAVRARSERRLAHPVGGDPPGRRRLAATHVRADGPWLLSGGPSGADAAVRRDLRR